MKDPRSPHAQVAPDASSGVSRKARDEGVTHRSIWFRGRAALLGPRWRITVNWALAPVTPNRYIEETSGLND